VAKRKRPDPAVTEKWVKELRPITAKLIRQRKAVEVTEKELGEAIRGAFDDGVLVGSLKDATGLSGSRVYQYKFQLRDQALEKKNA
jgi:hypothetical protein